MVRHFSAFLQRNTKLDYLSNLYILHCENGVFTLYSGDGELFARSCRFPLDVPTRQKIVWDAIRPDDKFHIREKAPGILSLIETKTGVVHDYLVLEGKSASVYNAALFLFVYTALSYHGYSPRGETMTMIPDPDNLSLDIDRSLVILQIENNAVVFCKGENTNCANHVHNILSDLRLNLYIKLLRGGDGSA